MQVESNTKKTCSFLLPKRRLSSIFFIKDSAVKYVIDLEKDIRTNLPYKIKRPAPPYFDRYGKKLLYSIFRKNKATQWYVFFNVYQEDAETILLIRYISNNHVSAQYIE